ncbi:histidine kinase N-terminal 7TM domain-containing protein [Methanocella sp. MCL-LM]|uniref:histidine kinase N-terminal 7TM domain-containing protein n=1 Tax=Methanocella sp. MCL-LM TaxID=3412035 RepID=UPI003C766605
MTLQFTVDVALFGIVALIGVALAAYVWTRRSAPGGTYFSFMMAGVAWWASAYAAEAAIVEPAGTLFFAKLSYAGIASVPLLWLLFTLSYSKHATRLTSKYFLLLWAVPVITVAMALTNDWHGWIWASVSLKSTHPNAFAFTLGPWFWVHAIYSYILILAGTGLLIKAALHIGKKRRHQIGMVILAAVFPLILNVLHVLRLDNFWGTDPTPIAFVLSGALITWGLFRYQLFDIVPIARETLIQNMADGVLVFDNGDRLADSNRAARRLIGPGELWAGQRVETVLARWPELAGRCKDRKETSLTTPIENEEGSRWLDIRSSLIRDGDGVPTGYLVVLHDITDIKRSEEEARGFSESLQAEIRERSLAEEEVKASLHEKEVLLKEIHHRVKNNLQIISSLLSLQSGTLCDEGDKNAFRESQNRIKTMALIHEKLYRSRDLSHIDFGDYARNLASHLASSYMVNPGVRIEIDTGDISLDIDQTIPCGLIINELVSNSLKYAFTDSRPGKIRVCMSKDGPRYTLTVSDDGAGLPSGFEFRSCQSLGLQLVNTLVDQLEGTIDLEPGAGTTFKITFKEIH